MIEFRLYSYSRFALKLITRCRPEYSSSTAPTMNKAVAAIFLITRTLKSLTDAADGNKRCKQERLNKALQTIIACKSSDRVKTEKTFPIHNFFHVAKNFFFSLEAYFSFCLAAFCFPSTQQPCYGAWVIKKHSWNFSFTILIQKQFEFSFEKMTKDMFYDF